MGLMTRVARVLLAIGLVSIGLTACGGGGDGAGGATIRGVVTILDDPVEGVSVQVAPSTADDEASASPSAADVLAKTTTDAQGRFTFEGLEPGGYLVMADVELPDIGGSGCRLIHTTDRLGKDGVATVDIVVSQSDIDAYQGGVGLTLNGDILACFR